MVSSPKMLSTDPLIPINCMAPMDWSFLFSTSHRCLIRLRSGKLPQSHCCSPQIIPEPFLCTLVPGVPQVGNAHSPRYPCKREQDQTKPTPSIAPWFSLDAHMPIVGNSTVDSGQHGHSNRSEAMQLLICSLTTLNQNQHQPCELQ